MEIVVQHFDGCPNWQTTVGHLTTLLGEERLRATLSLERIDSPEAAAEAQFRGSPTVLIDGVDPFAEPDAPFGLTCRIFITPEGTAGSPTLKQLESALASASED